MCVCVCVCELVAFPDELGCSQHLPPAPHPPPVSSKTGTSVQSMAVLGGESRKIVAGEPCAEGPSGAPGWCPEQAGPLLQHPPAPGWSWRAPRGSCDWASLVSLMFIRELVFQVWPLSAERPRLGEIGRLGRRWLPCSLAQGRWANHILPLILGHPRPGPAAPRDTVLALSTW